MLRIIKTISSIAQKMQKLDTVQAQQRDRLAFLESRLLFFGEVKRQDLIEKFAVHGAAATRDFKLYSQLAPNNLRYDRNAKRYLPIFPFIPVFEVSPKGVIAWFSGAATTDLPGPENSFPIELPATLGMPDMVILSALTRAIYRRQAVVVVYHSVSTGRTRRELVPFALVDNGLRWHVRAFDRKTNSFRDFVINRVIEVGPCDDHPLPHERPEQDVQWQRIVELELVPHPDRPNPEATLLDYGIKAAPLNLRLRAATAGYTLRKWNVDCSADHSLQGDEIRLWLQNSQCLHGVTTALLAPGYSD